MRRRGENVLHPVRPNAGVEAAYRRRLWRLIEEMRDSFAYRIKAAYRANEPIMARDDLPASEIQDAIRKLARQWQHRFDGAAPDLAKFFAIAASRRSDAMLKSVLKKIGFTVQFKMSRAMRDILKATIEQNVQLIKSIPEEYLTQVQGSVMRAVQTGRDLGPLAKEIEAHYGVTRRRAALIARHQNNMATAAMTHARQTEVGIEEAIWQHSGGGREPRPTHVANSGKRYKVAEGWFDPEKRVRRKIWPGELISCKCVSRPIVKGFT